MESLANDLTTLSAMEESSVKISAERFKLNELISELVTEAKRIGNNNHIFNLSVPAHEFVGDIKGIRAALGNIIFNAVKHNPEGVNVSISLEIENAGLVITITDDGIGFSKDDIPRLTERFFRGDRSRNFGKAGSLSLIHI